MRSPTGDQTAAPCCPDVAVVTVRRAPLATSTTSMPRPVLSAIARPSGDQEPKHPVGQLSTVLDRWVRTSQTERADVPPSSSLVPSEDQERVNTSWP